MRRRRRRPELDVATGERLLAWAEATDGRLVGGTRDALYLSSSVVELAETRIPWERVAAAEWDSEESLLQVVDVEGRRHALRLGDPRRLLQLVRERVTASVVLQRRVAVRGKHGLRVVARRAPGRTDARLEWAVEHDPEIDPDDAVVLRLAAAELAAARADVGDA